MKKERGIEEGIFCFVCKSDSEGKPMVMITKTIDGRICVHDGKCLERYEKLLNDSEEHKMGCILGVCIYCGKPVRSEQKYILTRWFEENRTSLTTFPKNAGEELLFTHVQCDENCCVEEEYP